MAAGGITAAGAPALPPVAGSNAGPAALPRRRFSIKPGRSAGRSDKGGIHMIVALILILAGIPLYALMKLPAEFIPEPAAAALRAERLELAVPSEAHDHA